MLRGKLPKESSVYFSPPTTCVDGHQDYLIDGQKVILELEVVDKRLLTSQHQMLVDIDRVDIDLQLKGMFKVNKFILESNPKLNRSPKRLLIDETSQEFIDWLEANLDLDTEYVRSDTYKRFTDVYPDYRKSLHQIMFFKWIKKWCAFKNIEFKEYPKRKIKAFLLTNEASDQNANED